MLDQKTIQDCVFTAIDRVNEVSLDQNMLAKDAATVLTGEAAQLDSMGFVNFVVALEEVLAARGLNLSVAEEINARGDAVPATMNVAAMVGFLSVLAREKAAASAT
jgi:hypothetical protein